MSKTETLTAEPIAHIVHILMQADEPSLAYGLLRDYTGQEELTNEEMEYIFEVVVEAGSASDAKALLEADTEFTEEFRTGFAME